MTRGSEREIAARFDGNDPVLDWTAAMRAGAFEQAWAINDRDLAALLRDAPDKHAGPRHLQRIWRGEPLQGRRVLVRCYHGLGDTLQFARFLPALGEIASDLTVWCQPPLLPLIAPLARVDRVLPLHDGAPEAEFDVDIEIMEIPHALRAGVDLIRPRGPYLKLPRDPAPQLRPSPRAFAVGLVWDVGDWDKRRVIPAPLLAALNTDGVELYSLQLGGAADAASIGAHDISTLDVVELGRRMAALDLVLSVDTMAAHLAGALGLPAWVMLHADCDWRWPLRQERTIWYPSLRLFHQRRSGDWASVVDAVRSALTTTVTSRRSPGARG